MARVFMMHLSSFSFSYVYKLAALVPISHSIYRYVIVLQLECSPGYSSTKPVHRLLCTYS